MLCLCRVAVLLAALLPVRVTLGVTQRRRQQKLQSFSFIEFTNKFGRSYAAGSEEYRRREAVFQKSMARIHAVNEQNAREGRPWSSGVHPFMDWTEQERKVLYSGYKPGRARADAGGRVGGSKFLAAIETKAKTVALSSQRSRLNATSRMTGSGQLSIRNQGSCGSCWAISTVEAVEAALLAQGVDVQLSAQALVDCVPNPQHCGGTGGCDGATAELGMQFIRDYGIPLESDLPYNQQTDACPVGRDGPWPTAKRARVSGWTQLPSNQLEPLKQALMLNGPVTIAVDGGNWMDYESGIFDGCEKDAVLSHGVLLKGYGEENGKKYWHVQNSWGSDWGEGGHIRLRMHDDEEVWCGIDNKPKDGVGCDGGPAQVRVCGMCGLLYDPVAPMGAVLEGGSSEASMADKNPYTGEEEFKPWRPPAAAADNEDASTAATVSALAQDPVHAAVQVAPASDLPEQEDPIKKMEAVMDEMKGGRAQDQMKTEEESPAPCSPPEA